MALEPLYYVVIVALIVLALAQQISLMHWKQAAREFRQARDAWKRLAGDYGHHQIGRDKINRHALPERTEDQ